MIRISSGLAVLLLVGCALEAFSADTVIKKDDAASTVVHGRLAGRLDAFLSERVSHGFSGSALIAQEGRIILCKGYGVADRVRNIPVTVHTAFDICSVTKQFTAAAILKLEMENRLQVSDPLGKYFENTPPNKQGITLHHLLTHTSGFVDVMGEETASITREEMVRAALSSKLRFQPGRRWAYSNLGYSLLAAVVELASGTSYEEYLHDHLFEPSGLSDTGYRLPNWSTEGIARGYRRGVDQGNSLTKFTAEDGPDWNLRGNGGMFSTVGDLYRWHLALQGESILSQEAKEKYFAPHMREDAGGKRYYGYGWTMMSTSRGTKRIGHSGSDGVFRADFSWYPDERVLLIITSNVAEHSCLSVERQLLSMIFEK